MKKQNKLLHQTFTDHEPELMENGIMGPAYVEADAHILFSTGEDGHINFKVAQGQLVLITYYNREEFWSVELWDNLPYFEELFKAMETITYKEFRNKLENDDVNWEVQYAD